MKVVVTDGDGFIGSNLAEDLRYFNVCEPIQDLVSEYAPVIPRFIQRALKGTALFRLVTHVSCNYVMESTLVDDNCWGSRHDMYLLNFKTRRPATRREVWR